MVSVDGPRIVFNRRGRQYTGLVNDCPPDLLDNDNQRYLSGWQAEYTLLEFTEVAPPGTGLIPEDRRAILEEALIIKPVQIVEADAKAR